MIIIAAAIAEQGRIKTGSEIPIFQQLPRRFGHRTMEGVEFKKFMVISNSNGNFDSNPERDDLRPLEMCWTQKSDLAKIWKRLSQLAKDWHEFYYGPSDEDWGIKKIVRSYDQLLDVDLEGWFGNFLTLCEETKLFFEISGFDRRYIDIYDGIKNYNNRESFENIIIFSRRVHEILHRLIGVLRDVEWQLNYHLLFD